MPEAIGLQKGSLKFRLTRWNFQLYGIGCKPNVKLLSQTEKEALRSGGPNKK